MNSVVLCDCGWMSSCSPAVAILNKHLRRHPSWFLPPRPTDRMNHHTALREYFAFPFACHRRQCILQPWCSGIHAKYHFASCKGFPQHSCRPWRTWYTPHRRMLPTGTSCWREQNLRLLHWIRLAEQNCSAVFQYHPEATSSNLKQTPIPLISFHHSSELKNIRRVGIATLVRSPPTTILKTK